MINNNKIIISSYILAAIALYLTLKLHLLPALLSGFLVFQLVRQGQTLLGRIGLLPRLAEVLLLILIAGIIITLLSLGVATAIPYLRGDSESLVALMQRMADVVDTARGHLPLWVQNYLPNSWEEWQTAISNWLRENAARISLVGRDFGVFLLHLIIGMVIGGIVAVNHDDQNGKGPLAKELKARVSLFDLAFRNVVFSQVRISALNTLFTSIYLLVIIRFVGGPLPFTAIIIAVTFICGLLPIIGNLLSNTVIVLIALSISPLAAVSSLIFLVVIHKLEYIINAKIVGAHISARVWELLITMLVMEVAFGIPGLIAAPIYYAYVKKELLAHKLI